MLEIQLERVRKSLQVVNRNVIEQWFTWTNDRGFPADLHLDPQISYGGQIEFRVKSYCYDRHDGQVDLPAEIFAMLVDTVFILDEIKYHFAGLKLDVEFGYYEDVDPAAIFIFRA